VIAVTTRSAAGRSCSRVHYLVAAAITNLSYAISDVANGLILRRDSPLKVSTWVAIFALAIFALPMFVFFGDELARLNVVNVLLIFAISSLGLTAYFCFLTGMQRAGVTLGGVITGSFPAVAAVAAVVFFGERISWAQTGTIVVIVAGLLLSSLQGRVRALFADIRRSSLIWAFAAALLFGLFFALVRIPVERVGWFLPAYLGNIIGVPLYVLIARSSGERDVLRLPKHAVAIAVIAGVQIGATMLYAYALTKGETAIVAPIAGSYPAVFVVLAYVVFRERIRAIQYVGIVATVAGIVGLSVLSA
jgi:drug/metabolite transporter (DMT)-like permease